MKPKYRRNPRQACAEFEAEIKPQYKDQFDHMHYVVLWRDATTGEQAIGTTIQEPRRAADYLREAIRQLEKSEKDEPLIIPAGIVPNG